jgi:hypothetical protein
LFECHLLFLRGLLRAGLLPATLFDRVPDRSKNLSEIRSRIGKAGAALL